MRKIKDHARTASKCEKKLALWDLVEVRPENLPGAPGAGY